MFIGDSFTLGWGVHFDSTFSQLIQKDLKSQSIETINLGIGNYNAVMEVELFKKKGYSSTLTLLCLCILSMM